MRRVVNLLVCLAIPGLAFAQAVIVECSAGPALLPGRGRIFITVIDGTVKE